MCESPAMTITTKLNEDLKTAMRAKDAVARDTLRMIKSDLEKAELEKGSALSGAEELAVLARAAKTRRESATQYDEGGRPELAEKERAEIKVVERYLPTALTEDEARAAIDAVAKELGITEKKQMGQLIKEAIRRHQGQLDGKLASKIASSLLS